MRIRLTTGESVQGELASVSETTAVLNVKHGQQMFERQELAELSVRKQGHRGRNTVIGLAAGAIS